MRQQIQCARWMDWLNREEAPAERGEFERHLAECETCRSEWDEWHAAAEALAMETEQIELPENLKRDVMNAIFDDAEKRQQGAFGLSRRKRWRRLGAISAAAVLVASLIVGVYGIFWRPYFVQVPDSSPAPAHRQAEWNLVSFDAAMPEAEGTATVVQQGATRQIVVRMSGMAATTQDNAYQVWLLEKGQRHNCGTFQVDTDGRGLIVYRIDASDFPFDAIGITLEPDAFGTAPRGKKVAGTKPASG